MVPPGKVAEQETGEELPTAAGMTLRDYRNATAAVVRVLLERGDHGFPCLDGAAVFTPGY
ncbi:hypothetical protein AHiyo4_02290 [Arthrobacter sp. Hiyo4]|nr:hypothetical protein AHiyo4_02290 [Arthrobacter sp. Hiyo4]